MRNKCIWTILAILMVLVTIVSCAAMPPAGGVSESEVKSSSATIYVPDDYSTIQAAVDAASAGDTIIVRNGTYIENIEVDKRLTIQSESGPDSTIVQAEDPGDNVFSVTADYVGISGFTVICATDYWKVGIYLHADYCNISNNNCSNNKHGIYLGYSNYNSISKNTCSNNRYGIALHNSNNNSISNSNCSNNRYEGIALHNSNNNSISNNNCSNSINTWAGIDLYESNNNRLQGNILVGSGILIEGDSLLDFTHEIDESNKVNGKPVYYWKDVKGGKIPDGAGQAILVNCTNVVVENQNLHDASVGIEIAFSSNITLENNYCSSNSMYGILLLYSDNNFITNNHCLNNDDGIHLWHSSSNIISANNASNDVSIHLENSSNNKITNNNVLNNIGGIYLEDSSNNTISNNTVSLNGDFTISLWCSSNNTIMNNEILRER